MKTRKSLASSSAFETFVLDQLSGVGEIVTRKMFGGVGLYGDGLFFGLIARDALYLKVNEATRGAFEAEGARPFRRTAISTGMLSPNWMRFRGVSSRRAATPVQAVRTFVFHCATVLAPW